MEGKSTHFKKTQVQKFLQSFQFQVLLLPNSAHPQPSYTRRAK